MRFKYALSTLLIGAGLIAAGLAVYQFMFPAAPHKQPILGGRSTIHSYALGRDYVVEVNDEAIERSPRWNQFKRNPPLAARDAMVAADKLRIQMI